jgi:hypothetical protein
MFACKATTEQAPDAAPDRSDSLQKTVNIHASRMRHRRGNVPLENCSPESFKIVHEQ